MGSFWNEELRAEIAQLQGNNQIALEKQRYNEGLIRVLKDSRTQTLFAALEVARVAQLDSATLDDELVKILRDQTERTAKIIPALGTLVTTHRSELDLFLRFLLWWFSMRLNFASPGEVLQNLRFRDERKFSSPHTRGLLTLPNDGPTRSQRVGHLMLSVLLPWMWNRLRDRAVEERWGENRETEHFWSGLEAADKAYRVAALANFLFLLVDGRYRCLTDRILKMRLIPAKNESVRAVSFELINQQLLFEGFSEILLVILPLVDWSAFLRTLIKWKNLSQRLFWRMIPQALIDRISFLRKTSEGGENPVGGVTAEDEKYRCVSCGENPAIMACRTTPCEHIYCYYCLKSLSSRSNSSSLSCLACDNTIESSERI